MSEELRVGDYVKFYEDNSFWTRDNIILDVDDSDVYKIARIHIEGLRSKTKVYELNNGIECLSCYIYLYNKSNHPLTKIFK